MNLTKRQKISLSTVILGLGLFTFPLFSAQYSLYLLIALVVGSYLLSVWALYRDLAGFEFITLFVLPVLLTLSFVLFVDLFSTSAAIRFVLALVYSSVYYTCLLAENIFNVSANRNIPLLRAARTVGYLITLFVSFAFFSLVFGLGLDWWQLTLISLVAGVLLFVQALWQIELEETLSRPLVINSLAAGFIIAQLAAALSFWPLDPPKFGLAITALVYVTLGILQHMIQKDLTKRATLEYVFVAFSMFLLLLVTTSWGI